MQSGTGREGPSALFFYLGSLHKSVHARLGSLFPSACLCGRYSSIGFLGRVGRPSLCSARNQDVAFWRLTDCQQARRLMSLIQSRPWHPRQGTVSRERSSLGHPLEMRTSHGAEPASILRQNPGYLPWRKGLREGLVFLSIRARRPVGWACYVFRLRVARWA